MQTGVCRSQHMWKKVSYKIYYILDRFWRCLLKNILKLSISFNKWRQAHHRLALAISPTQLRYMVFVQYDIHIENAPSFFEFSFEQLLKYTIICDAMFRLGKVIYLLFSYKILACTVQNWIIHIPCKHFF